MTTDGASRYQIFVSSTYSDLRNERQLVTQALLKMGRCFPAGMELFTASSLPAWDVITRALDGTDYLVLILANRYGSAPGGGLVSYTEREYEYAIEHGIPVLAFLSRGRPLQPEQQESDAARERMHQFRRRVEQHHTVQYWSAQEELGQQVPTALYREFNTHPRPGWVRGVPTGTFLDGENLGSGQVVPSRRGGAFQNVGGPTDAIARELARRPPSRGMASLLLVAEPGVFAPPDALTSLTGDTALLQRVVSGVAATGPCASLVAPWVDNLGGRDVGSLTVPTSYAEGVALSSRSYPSGKRPPGDRSGTYDYCEVAVTDNGGVRIFAEPLGWRTGLNLVAEPGLDLDVPVVLTRRLLDLIPAIWEHSARASLPLTFDIAIRSVNASNLPAFAEPGPVTSQRLQGEFNSDLVVSLEEIIDTPGDLARKLLRNLLRHFGALDRYAPGLVNGRLSLGYGDSTE